jgi:hypothetical protein
MAQDGVVGGIGLVPWVGFMFPSFIELYPYFECKEHFTSYDFWMATMIATQQQNDL